MCMDLERWGALDDVNVVANQSERKREEDLRELLDHAQVLAPVTDQEQESVPAVR